MSARKSAARVLLRVFQDDAYAAAALSAELGRAELESRDRALATEITYGVLRTDKYLRRRLARFGKIKESDGELLVHLLVAAYQIDFLDRVPARAAVHEAVELIGAFRDARVAGFANAILRRLAESNDEKLPIREAVFASTPSWLRKRLHRDVGPEASEALLVPAFSPRPVLRIVGERHSAGFQEFLEQKCEAIYAVPGAYRYRGGGDPRARAEFAEGAFVVQELGAQMVAHALGARPGERILDACAGRGQKTSLLAELVGPTGRVVATDLHDHKLRLLEEEMGRLHHQVETRTWDFTRPPPEDFLGAFDRVLVDAPCSGVGTLGRRPEISRRLGPEDPARLAEVQVSILRHASLAVKPGGLLLFATCSVLREEAEAVLEQVLNSDEPLNPTSLEEANPTLPIDPALFPDPLPRTPRLRLLPHLHGTDGYFLGRLRRTGG